MFGILDMIGLSGRRRAMERRREINDADFIAMSGLSDISPKIVEIVRTRTGEMYKIQKSKIYPGDVFCNDIFPLWGDFDLAEIIMDVEDCYGRKLLPAELKHLDHFGKGTVAQFAQKLSRLSL